MSDQLDSSQPDLRVRELFIAALRLPEGAEREHYVVDACHGDDRLKELVLSLLSAHEDTTGFALDRDALGESLDDLTEAPGTVIGRYRLIERLGEGGFGVVYRAEQTEPVQRQVALKIIKLGMDTKEVITRFEAERQALALMEHPNIARVYDAGATEKGRPYFVMELACGPSITEHCDTHRLPLAKRFELFLQICSAVDHAHSKGIIHRDLKPSNVVVTLQDGKPVPKVIDFGIAKSIQGPLTTKTLFTRRESLLGTPAYMSPEQLQLDQGEVNVRTDIYSLGVLLYELIAGAPPFESERLRKEALAEVSRILREVDPPKPSARFEKLGGQTTKIADRRALEPLALQRQLRGDLDWIVMRAIEKDPRRRYATAANLAQDLQHHLRHEPVAAGPPGIAYRAQKFTQRHRVTLAWVSVIAVILVAGGLFSLRKANEARQAAERAREAAVQARSAVTRAGQPTAETGARGLIQGIVNVENRAQLSPDETMLAYVRWDLADADLWVRDLTTGETRNLTESEKHAPGIYECCGGVWAWSRDSEWIAYVWQGGPEAESSLRLVPAHGGDLKILKPEHGVTRYLPDDWTPDGRNVLCRMRGQDLQDALVLVSVDTGEVRELLTYDSPEPLHPRLSPDGAMVTFALESTAEGGDAKHDIHLLDIATGRTNQLTFASGDDTGPIWALKEPVVLFSSDRLGTWDLWGVRVENDQPVPSPFPVRLGVGNHAKRLTQSGKLVVHRQIGRGEGYKIALPQTLSVGTSSTSSLIRDRVEPVPMFLTASLRRTVRRSSWVMAWGISRLRRLYPFGTFKVVT